MRIINKLRRPGEIRSVTLYPEYIVVRTTDNEEIIYRRGDYVQATSEDSLRRGSLYGGR